MAQLSAVLTLSHSAVAPEEKERCLNSVIQVLSGEEALQRSTANARTLVMRAELYASLGRWKEALDDATTVLKSVEGRVDTESNEFRGASGSIPARGYRILADSYQQQGDFVASIQALRSMVTYNPAWRTKATQEIERLQQQKIQQ